MQISPVSYNVQKNNNMNFEGKMTREVVKSVKRLEVEQIKTLVSEYNSKGRTITDGAINKLRENTNACIQNIREYVKALPKDVELYVSKEKANFERLMLRYKKGKNQVLIEPASSQTSVDGRVWYRDVDYIKDLNSQVQAFKSPKQVDEIIANELQRKMLNDTRWGKIKTLTSLEKKYNSLKERFTEFNFIEFDELKAILNKNIELAKVKKENQKRIPLLARIKAWLNN